MYPLQPLLLHLQHFLGFVRFSISLLLSTSAPTQHLLGKVHRITFLSITGDIDVASSSNTPTSSEILSEATLIISAKSDVETIPVE